MATPKRPSSPPKSAKPLKIRSQENRQCTQQEIKIENGAEGRKATSDRWPIPDSPRITMPKKNTKKKILQVPSVGTFLRGSLKTGVKAKDKEKIPQDEVLIFAAVHGFLPSTERKTRKIVLTVKRGDSTFTESDAWQQVLIEVSRRLGSPFPIRRLYQENGKEITSFEALKSNEVVIGTSGNKSETKKNAESPRHHGSGTNNEGTYGWTESLKFDVVLVTEVEHLGANKIPIVIPCCHKGKQSPLSDASLWSQVLRKCTEDLSAPFAIRKLYKGSGQEICNVQALKDYAAEGGCVRASTTTVLPVNMRRASLCSDFISRQRRPPLIHIQKDVGQGEIATLGAHAKEVAVSLNWKVFLEDCRRILDMNFAARSAFRPDGRQIAEGDLVNLEDGDWLIISSDDNLKHTCNFSKDEPLTSMVPANLFDF